MNLAGAFIQRNWMCNEDIHVISVETIHFIYARKLGACVYKNYAFIWKLVSATK